MWCQWQYRKGKNRKEYYFVVWLFVFVSLKTHTQALGAGGAGGAAAPPETDFRGCLAPPPPAKNKLWDIMGFYVNNNHDKVCFFYAACIFHFFHSFFFQNIFTTNNNFKFPNGIYASGKGIAQNWHTSDQSGIWAMPCGQAPGRRGCWGCCSTPCNLNAIIERAWGVLSVKMRISGTSLIRFEREMRISGTSLIRFERENAKSPEWPRNGRPAVGGDERVEINEILKMMVSGTALKSAKKCKMVMLRNGFFGVICENDNDPERKFRDENGGLSRGTYPICIHYGKYPPPRGGWVLQCVAAFRSGVHVKV